MSLSISYTEYLIVFLSVSRPKSNNPNNSEILLFSGPQIIKRQNLSGTVGLVLDQYDKFLNPATLVSFTSAAFRVLHTMIPADVKLVYHII